MNDRFAYVNAWIKQHRIDISVWGIFILYETLIAGIYRGSFDSVSNYAIHYTINIALFYVQALRVLPWAFNSSKRTYWRLPLGIISVLFLYITTVYFVDMVLLKYTDQIIPSKESSNYIVLLGISWRGLYFTLLGTGYYFIRAYLKKREQLAAMERERLTALIEEETLKKNLERAKNAYLSAQVNPHFLFNTLNFVYHDVRKHSERSAELIERLADIMRYGVDADYYAKPVTLAEEMEQVFNLIHVHQILKSGSLNLKVQYDQRLSTIQLLPQTILPLVENLFKHGDLSKETHPASVDIYQQDDTLFVKVFNRLDSHTLKPGKRTGLNNVSDRLRYAYNDAATLHYVKDDEQKGFMVTMCIPLTL